MFRAWYLFGVWILVLGVSTTAHAYPPAPHHTLYGMIRSQWGDPINVTGAEVFIQNGDNAGVRAMIAPSTEPGMNYRMDVPMDAGLTLDAYQATALLEGEPFQLKVVIGTTVYVPIEMTFSSSELGQPGGLTRLDLTLGVDSDGDGLPDAWEQAIIAMLGGTLEGITPDGDSDGDGIKNIDEFLAGTLAFDPNNGFRLVLSDIDAGKATLEFLAVRGRTYTIQATTDLKVWKNVGFRIVTKGVPGEVRDNFSATQARLLRLEIPSQPGAESYRYFKAQVQ